MQVAFKIRNYQRKILTPFSVIRQSRPTSVSSRPSPLHHPTTSTKTLHPHPYPLPKYPIFSIKAVKYLSITILRSIPLSSSLSAAATPSNTISNRKQEKEKPLLTYVSDPHMHFLYKNIVHASHNGINPHIRVPEQVHWKPTPLLFYMDSKCRKPLEPSCPVRELLSYPDIKHQKSLFSDHLQTRPPAL